MQNGNKADRTVQIYTGDTFTLGRNGQKVDMVTTILPATKENNEKSSKISREHCVISIRKQNRVILSDCNSKNGVTVQGTRVTKEHELTDGSRLVLANVFRLDFHEFRELASIREISEIRQNALTINEYSTRIGGLKLEVLRRDIPLDCFSLSRCDEYSSRLQYLFLRRFVGIGSSISNGLYLDHPSVAKKHARLILMENGYYLEALDTQSETWMDNKRLYPGMPQPLPVNRAVPLRFGESTASFFTDIQTGDK